MLCPRPLHAAACAFVVLCLAGTACRENERVSGSPTLVQPTPDRTVDAVVRGLATLAPLVEPTSTPEPDGGSTAPADTPNDDDITQGDEVDETAEDWAAEPINEFEVEAEDPADAIVPAAEQQLEEDDEASASVNRQRGDSRKVRPTATTEADAQLQAANAEEPLPADVSEEVEDTSESSDEVQVEAEAEPTPKVRKKRRS
jgi:hypothetical protein